MELVFRQGLIPRTTTRAQWREISRWRRNTQRILRDAIERRRDNLAFYGIGDLRFAREIDHIVNPPICVYP